jgi:hypothetical protein
VGTALAVFGLTVPRATRHPERVHKAALIHSGIALVLALPASVGLLAILFAILATALPSPDSG